MKKKIVLSLVIISLLLTPLTVLNVIALSNPNTLEPQSNNDLINQQLDKIQDKKLTVDTTIGDKQVIFFEHIVNDFQIKNDSILIHKDESNGEIISFKQVWRDTSKILEDTIKTDFSTVNLENFCWKKKIVFMEEKDCMDFYKFNEPVAYPVFCLEVRMQNGTTILYNEKGEKIGAGVPAPAEGFLLTGPDDGDDVWHYLRSNAEMYYSRWTDSVTSIFNPYPSTEISPKVSNPDVQIFYEIAHGGSTYFKAHTSENYYADHCSKANVEDDINGRSPMSFAFIGSCNGMTLTYDGTFSYEFRKGQMTDTVTVGYSGMYNDDGWPKAKPWQDAMFTYMEEGYTVKDAFDNACAEYPTIADVVRFVGDETFKITEIGNIAPVFPKNPTPSYGAIMQEVTTDLSWSGGDANNGDTVTYEIYLGTDPNPPKIATIGPYSGSQKIITYNPSILEYNTKYYWKIVAIDNHGKTTAGPLWYFTTIDPPGNNPPYFPDDPSPANNEIITKPEFEDADVDNDGDVDEDDIEIVRKAVMEETSANNQDVDIDNDGDVDGVDLDIIIWYVHDYIAIHLQIKVIDPDNDDTDVAFYWETGELIGINENVPTKRIGRVKTQNLTPGGSYQWYATVSDGEYTIQSDIFGFTIDNPDHENNPPYEPSNPTPKNGLTTVEINTILIWSGGDPDNSDTVIYDIYLGTNQNLDSEDIISHEQETTSYNLNYLDYNTTYYWKIVAKDNHGATNDSPIWSFTTKEKNEEINLEINLWKSLNFRNLEFNIENLGSQKTTEVTWNISINGLLLCKTDFSDNGTIEEIKPDEVKTVTSKDLSFSFGFVEVKIEVKTNGKTFTKQQIGFILGKILII